MISALLNKLVAGESLSSADAATLLAHLISDEASDAMIAAVLVALAAKGETADELTGFAETMRAKAARVTTAHELFIDTCGTGGSSAKTINVSTAAAFVVSATGLPVAKHGNVGVTSKVGSADVLRALDIVVEADPEAVGEMLDVIGIGFMFAPVHHSATARVAKIRRQLGIRTIFNLLGPLTNPAGAPYQLAGVSHPTGAKRLAQALFRLGTKRAWVVRGRDGLDEITLSGPTQVFEAGVNGVQEFEVTPSDFGIEATSISHLTSGSAAENAAVIEGILSGERRDAARDLVAINAATSLYIAGRATSLADGYVQALKTLESGAALIKLRQLRDFTPVAADKDS